MDDPRLDYLPREDATPEGELAALTAVYALVIQAHELKKAAAPANEKGKGWTRRSGSRARIGKPYFLARG